jgi:hypothetical protein
MQTGSIFRRESLDRVASPEKLNDYIRVSSPGVWLMLGALIVIVVCLAVWGFTGTLPVTLTLNGVTEDGTVACFVPVEDIKNEIMGCRAQITLPDGSTVGGAVTQVAALPAAAEELAATLEKDWLVSRLVAGDYSYRVTIGVESHLSPGELVRVALVTAEVKPIRYILS